MLAPFRAPTFEHARLILTRLARFAVTADNVSPRVVVTILVALGLQLLPRGLHERVRDRFTRSPSWVQGVVLAAMAYGVHFAASVRPQPFVYGQF